MLIVTIMSFICALREKMNTFIKCISYTGSWSYNVKGLWCQGWPLECGDHCVPVLNREGTLSGWFDVVHPPYFIILFVTLPTKQVICFGEKNLSGFHVTLCDYLIDVQTWQKLLRTLIFFTVTCVIEDIYLYEWQEVSICHFSPRPNLFFCFFLYFFSVKGNIFKHFFGHTCRRDIIIKHGFALRQTSGSQPFQLGTRPLLSIVFQLPKAKG